jgi:transcriptional regulator with XRE-family HTH domain
MSEALRFWLSEELNRRGWSHRELARQIETSQSFVSRIIKGENPPSVNFCYRIAQALEVSPETVLRLAGILPPASPGQPSDDSTLQELVELARTLTPENRQDVLEYVKFRISQQSKKFGE